MIGAIKHLKEKLLPIHRRLQTVIIECLDWQKCIDRYDRENVVMYIDPPYPDNKCNYAHNMREWAEYEKLAFRLSATKCKWIVSSYDKPEIRNLFQGNYVIPVQSFSGMNVRKNDGERVVNKEVLITNYLPPEHLASTLTKIATTQSSPQLAFATMERGLNKTESLPE